MQELFVKAVVAMGLMRGQIPPQAPPSIHIEECAKEDSKSDYANSKRPNTPRPTAAARTYWSTLSDEEDEPATPVVHHRNTWMPRSRSISDFDGDMDETTMGERTKDGE